LLGLGASLLCGCAQHEPMPLPDSPEPALPRRSLAPLAERTDPDRSTTVPVLDFHTHLQRGVSAESLVQKMDAAGVARMVLMPLYYGDRPGVSVNDGEGSDEQAAEYARRYPDRFVPFAGMQRPELNNHAIWHRPSSEARRLVEETDVKLRSGEFFGMGEFMIRFYPYTNRFGIVAPSDMSYPADSFLMRTFADLSAKYRAPMVIHAEAEPHVLEAMVRLLERHPEAIIVWAHNCGRSSAETIAGLLARFPRLHADLGGMVYSGPGVQHYGVYWPNRTPWMHLVVDGSGRLRPEMKALLETYADRFLIGTDIAHARVYEIYGRHLPRWRLFFAQLSGAAAQKIAHGNGDRLFARAPVSGG
jgi:predicted TIM-barrel fold metal-dependent hydrolase